MLRYFGIDVSFDKIIFALMVLIVTLLVTTLTNQYGLTI